MEEVQLQRTTTTESKHKGRNGSMNRDFRFPSPSSSPVQSNMPTRSQKRSPPPELNEPAAQSVPPVVVTPASIEVPAPPPVEKENSASNASLDEGEDEVGDTVDIPLN